MESFFGLLLAAPHRLREHFPMSTKASICVQYTCAGAGSKSCTRQGSAEVGFEGFHYFTDFVKAAEAAFPTGWVREGKDVLCPECQEKRNPPRDILATTGGYSR
jgi:hypothetical protein